MALDALARHAARTASPASACWRTTAARAWRTGSRRTIRAGCRADACCSTSRPRSRCTEDTSLAFRARLLALVLPGPAAAAARSADRVRSGALPAQRDGQAAMPASRPSRPRRWPSTSAARAIAGHRAGICEDYRASAGIDLEHDRADVAAEPQAHPALARAVGRARRRRPLLRRARAVARARPRRVGPHPAVRPLHSPRRRRASAGRGAAFFNSSRRIRDMSTKRIAVIAGDGIGKETMPEGCA